MEGVKTSEMKTAVQELALNEWDLFGIATAHDRIISEKTQKDKWYLWAVYESKKGGKRKHPRDEWCRIVEENYLMMGIVYARISKQRDQEIEQATKFAEEKFRKRMEELFGIRK